MFKIYIKLSKFKYDESQIKRAFKNIEYEAIFITNFNNLKKNSYILIGNNEREILPKLKLLLENHKIIIIKNTFCYDTIPTINTIKYFEGADTNKIIYVDSGIYYNKLYDYKDLWHNNNINYKIYKHSLLNYCTDDKISYKKFCKKHNLNPSFKLATFFINSCISIWHTRNTLKNENIKQEGDRFIVENFVKIKKIFNEFGYNLIIKEHRDKFKQLKFYLDYIKKYGVPKGEFPKENNDLIDYKSKFNMCIKPYIKILSKLHNSIVSNAYENEILSYSTIGIIGSCTTMSNILYSYNIKTLYIDSINGSWLNGISKRLKFDFKALLYGIYVYDDEISKNIKKYIAKIISYNQIFKFKNNHPFYGNANMSNYDYFVELIKILNLTQM